MQCEKKEENVTNLVTWLHQEAMLRSRGKRETEAERGRDPPYHRKTDQHFTDASMTADESCPLSCKSKYLVSYPIYQGSNLKQRWEIVKQNRRCQKCQRVSHHTKDCKRADSISCDKCKKNHHNSLHNEKNNKSYASIFRSQGSPSAVENRSIQEMDNEKTREVRNILGICPMQKSQRNR